MNSVPFTIDEDSKVKRYYQLYTHFAESIAEGKIPAGEKLPSIRAIAEQLNLGRNTVVKAYDLLEEEGFIFSYEKSGFFVKDRGSNAFIQQNLPKPGEDAVPTVDSIVKQRKSSESKTGMKVQPLDEFAELIAETTAPQETDRTVADIPGTEEPEAAAQEESAVSQSELDALLGEGTTSTTKQNPGEADGSRTDAAKENLDAKVASIMQQIQWESEDDGSQTLTQAELDAVLSSGTVTTVAQADMELEQKLSSIMQEIHAESEDDGSQTLSQSELDAILSSTVVSPESEAQEPEPDFPPGTDMEEAIDMGTEDDFVLPEPAREHQQKESTMTDTDSPFGDARFRSTVTEFLALHKRIQCTPKQLVGGANVEELISNALLAIRAVRESKPKAERPRGLLRLAQLAESGELHAASDDGPEIIAIPSNGAESLQFLADVGFTVKELFCDIHGVTPQELSSSQATVLVITTTSASAKRRSELLQWVAEKESRYIIEYDKEANGAIPSLQGEDKSGRVIYAGAASDMVPKFHSCWIVMPEALLDIYEKQFSAEELELSSAEQQKLVEFIESGELDQYLSAQDF